MSRGQRILAHREDRGEDESGGQQSDRHRDRLRGLFRLDRGAGELALHAAQPLAGPASLRAADALLGLLRRAGLGARDAMLSYQALSGYVYGTAITGSPPRQDALTHTLAKLASSDHRALSASAASNPPEAWGDEAFRHGLKLLLDGIASIRRAPFR